MAHKQSSGRLHRDSYMRAPAQPGTRAQHTHCLPHTQRLQEHGYTCTCKQCAQRTARMVCSFLTVVWSLRTIRRPALFQQVACALRNDVPCRLSSQARSCSLRISIMPERHGMHQQTQGLCLRGYAGNHKSALAGCRSLAMLCPQLPQESVTLRCNVRSLTGRLALQGCQSEHPL